MMENKMKGEYGELCNTMKHNRVGQESSEGKARRLDKEEADVEIQRLITEYRRQFDLHGRCQVIRDRNDLKVKTIWIDNESVGYVWDPMDLMEKKS
jgi:hypothetical protein